MTETESIHVEVAYAEPERQWLIELAVPTGTTLAEAVDRSGILDRVHGLELREGWAGVFGRGRPLDFVLRPGDRVELYRPLEIDPKEARRRRAAGD